MALSQILENRNVKISLWIVAGILVTCLGIATWVDRIHQTQKNIQKYWLIVAENVNHRVEMLAPFARFISGSDPRAQTTVQLLAAAYEKAKHFPLDEKIIDDAASMQAFGNLQQEIVQALVQLNIIVQSNPTLAQNQHYVSLQNQLKAFEAQIIFASSVLERQIEYYNSLITGFPEGWVNMIYPQYHVKYFSHIATLENEINKRK